MAHEKMPHHGLKCFRMWRHGFRIYRGNDADTVADLRRIASVAPDHSQNLRSDVLGVFKRANEIGAHILLQTAAADGEHKDHVIGTQSTDLEPLGEYAIPALVIGARGQF